MMSRNGTRLNDLVLYLFITVLDGRNTQVTDGVQRALARPVRILPSMFAERPLQALGKRRLTSKLAILINKVCISQKQPSAH